MTSDDFRALARSSPWLWQTLQFTLDHHIQVYPARPLRAFIRRPSGIRVEQLDGRIIQRDRLTAGVVGTRQVDGEPERRADGLVARRPGPDGDPYRFDDPMFQSYLWTAMLHPFELADGVDADGWWSPSQTPIQVVDGPHEVQHHGRTAWEARIVTTPAYAARCSCCPLLDGEEAHRRGVSEGWAMPDDVVDRPSAWTVCLDRGTGVVVSLSEIGGIRRSGWSMTIEAVDSRMPRSLFGPG